MSSLGTPATELSAGLAGRLKLFIKSFGGNPDVFIGPSSVTVTTGYLVRAKEELWLDVAESCAVFAIAASGSADIRVLEAGE